MNATTTGRCDNAGVQIYYETYGAPSGMPLIVINGGPGFDHTYLLASPVWEELGRHRPLVLYDQRGNGKSSPVGKDDTCGLAEQLSDLDALRQHLGYERVDVLGHSWGGYLAMAYTARYPLAVRRLVLVDSAAPRIQDTVFLFENIYPETSSLRKELEFAIELEDEVAIEADIQAYYTMLFYSDQARDAFIEKAGASPFYYKVNKKVWDDLQRFDLNPQLAKFNLPSLVITGRYDFNVAPSVAYKIQQAIPGARLEVFAHSGHLPFVEEPQAFVELVEGFLIED
jgi:proline iminopeptidase